MAPHRQAAMPLKQKFWSTSSTGEPSSSSNNEVTISESTGHSDAPGLHVLYDSTYASSTSLNERKDESCLKHVDIIAVHGLGGGAFTTWTDKDTGKLWLRDLLPPFLAHSRIMSYGYDASVYPSRSTLHILNYAENLLFELNTYRRSENEQKRHIVFVGHSLGGLVIKKALNLARNERKYRSIYTITRGIMFMGTPHDGADAARLASTIVRIASTVTKFNTSNLSLLNRDSDLLIDISRAFGFMDHLDIVTVLESNETLIPYTRISKLIVPESSARLNVGDRETVFSITGADHHRICKFKGGDDGGFRKVMIALQELASSGEVHPLQFERNEHNQARQQLRSKVGIHEDIIFFGLSVTFIEACLQSLFFLEMNYRRYDIADPSATTCTWLSEHQTYLKWFNEQRGLLWVKGKPGAGKSTLLKYTYETVKRDGDEKSVFASFYFHGHGALIQKSPLGLFRSILHQLAQQIPDLLGYLTSLYKKKSEVEKNWEWHERELRNIFSSYVSKLTEVYSVRIYIDALDECGEEAAINLVEFFEAFAGSFGVCFSCRHYPLIALVNGLEISVEDKNTRDIEIYITNRLTSRIKNVDLVEEFRGATTKKSSGIFQWVVLVADRILKLHHAGKSRAYILGSIQSSPAEVKELYRDLLVSIEKDDLSQSLHLMQWVCFAMRPLSITEIRFAMVVRAETSCTSIRQCQATPEYVETDEQMERNICDLSKGLIEIQSHDGKRLVQFIHQSVKDYLLETGLEILDSNSMDSTTGRGHFWLSRSCIKYLSMEEILSYDFENEKRGSGEFDDQFFPFLRYSVGYWVTHARQVEKENIPQDDLVAKFHPSSGNVQQWIYICERWHCTPFLLIPSEGSNILHIASLYNLRSVVIAGLAQGLDPNAMNLFGEMPLHYAASEGFECVVKLLLEKGAKAGSYDYLGSSYDYLGRTPLSYAAAYGHAEVVKLLLEREDVEVNLRNLKGETSLYHKDVDVNGVTDSKSSLQRADIDVNYEWDGRTALFWATRYRHDAVIEILKRRGAS